MAIHMNTQVGIVSAADTMPATQGGTRDTMRALGKALRQDDLAAAQQAWSTLSEKLPRVVTQRPDSALAGMGQALAEGDIGAAKALLQEATAALRERRAARLDGEGPGLPGGDCGMPADAGPSTLPTTAPTMSSSSTGGAAGTVIDIVA